MNLIIDAGNTRIKLALFEGRRMVEFARQTNWNVPAIVSMMEGNRVDCAILSAVREVPDELYQLLRQPGIRFAELTSALPLPLKIDYQTPETLGKDRIAAAAGAWLNWPHHDLLVIDAGTALTMDLVTSDGVYRGGVISPGYHMRIKALHHYTGRLPLVEANDNPPMIGKSTAEAIQAGVLNGMVYEVDNFINSLKNKYNGLRVILTGGDAQRLILRAKNSIFVEPYLVLNGLNCILTHNEK